jgi:LCP family protein required for cell wall assembly
MSDGDNAAPGRRAASDSNGDHRSMTRWSSGAAPWERWQTPSHYAAAGPPGRAPRGAAPSRPGSHADGALTVADLIARVSGTASSTRSSHRHAAPETEEPEPAAEPALWQYDEIARRAYASELPDLDQVHGSYTRTDPPESEQTTVLPTGSRRVPPVRVGQPPTAMPPAENPAPARRPMLLAGRTVAVLMAVLTLALTGGAWQWSTSKNNSLNQVSALDPNSHDVVDPSAQYGDENFLIVGTDTRAGENSDVGAGDTEDAGGARSDTIMLVNIPANRKRVVVVSFPRDLAITPIKCEAWNPDTGAYGSLYYEETGTYGPDMVYSETKLNSTYSFGGPKCLVKEIQKLSGLSINRFMAVDFVGFAKMVDALGGVEVCSTSRLYDYELGTVLDHSGRQIVDGSTALNYVRARNVSTEFNGDYGRIKRQQLFLSSLLRSLISKDTFFSLTKLNNVVNMFISDSYVDNVKTKDLVGLGQSLQGVSAGHITFVTVPTGETDENGDEPPRTADMRALFDAIIDDDPLPGENDQNATSTPTTEPARTTTQPSPTVGSHSQQVRAVTTAPYDVTVRVSNATGEPGLAATASGKLEQEGFNVMTPDDYPDPLKSTTVLFSPGNEQAAATVASALANPPIQRVTGMGQVVQVVLGPDFRSVSTPAPSGSSVSVQLTRGTSSASAELPEDLTVTNAADTTCE